MRLNVVRASLISLAAITLTSCEGVQSKNKKKSASAAAVYIGSCTMNISYGNDATSQTFKLCLYFDQYVDIYQEDPEDACKQGGGSFPPGSWSAGPCDKNGVTASCTMTNLDGGRYLYHVYHSGANDSLKDGPYNDDICEGGTYEEFVPDIKKQASVTTFENDSASSCMELRNISSLAYEMEKSYQESLGATTKWQDDGACDKAAKVVASCEGFTSQDGYKVANYFYKLPGDVLMQQEECENGNGIWTEP